MKKALLPLFLLAALSVPASAQYYAGNTQAYDEYGRPNPDAFEWTGFSLGVQGGTLGLGGEVNYYLLDWLNLRASAHVFPLTYKDTIENYDVDFDFDFMGLLLTLDFYPGHYRGFRISLGGGLNDNETTIDGSARSGSGSFSGKASYDSFAPYFGIGFGNPVQPDSAFTFTFDMGVMLQDYSLSLPEGVSATVKSEIEDILDYATIYPVIMFGIHYHF